MKKFLKLTIIAIVILLGMYLGYLLGRFVWNGAIEINEIIVKKDCYEWQKLERDHEKFELGKELVDMCAELNIKIK